MFQEKRGNIWKIKSMSLQGTVRTRTSDTCIEEYMNFLEDQINELARNSKNKNIRHLYRGIHEFKRAYQPKRN
jgi:hypothetical protein